jgi:hypothetical protein
MNRDTLLRLAEHAAGTPAVVNPALRGWVHHDGGGDSYLCADCAGRMLARGHSISPATPVWHDSPDPACGVECVVCDREPPCWACGSAAGEACDPGCEADAERAQDAADRERATGSKSPLALPLVNVA